MTSKLDHLQMSAVDELMGTTGRNESIQDETKVSDFEGLFNYFSYWCLAGNDGTGGMVNIG